MKLRMPRPLTLFLLTFILVVSGIGPRFGVPANRQWSAITQLEPYTYWGGGLHRERHVGPNWLRGFFGERRMIAFDEIEEIGFSPNVDRDPLGWLGRRPDAVVDDDMLPIIRWLPDLKKVSLSCTNISDISLEHVCSLRKLEILDLAWTDVSDASIPFLKRLTNLRELSLRGTRVTDVGMEHLSRHPSLEILHLDGTDVSDASIPLLKRLKNLKELSLRGPRVSEEGVKELERALPGLDVTR